MALFYVKFLLFCKIGKVEKLGHRIENWEKWGRLDQILSLEGEKRDPIGSDITKWGSSGPDPFTVAKYESAPGGLRHMDKPYATKCQHRTVYPMS